MTEIEAIEQELSANRANLEGHVDKLAEKLTIGSLVDEFVLGDRVNWPDIASNDTLYKLIIPGALVGAGAAMFFAGGGVGKVSELLSGSEDSRKAKADERDHSADIAARQLGRSLDALDRNLVRTPGELDAAYAARRHHEHSLILDIERAEDESDEDWGHRIGAARERAANLAHEATQRIEAAAAKAKHAAEHAAEVASRKAEAAAAATKSQYEDNPAIAIAVSTAVGALLGAFVPMSRTEEEALSKPVDLAAQKLAAGARATAETAQRAAERIHHATRDVRKAEAGYDRAETAAATH